MGYCVSDYCSHCRRLGIWRDCRHGGRDRQDSLLCVSGALHHLPDHGQTDPAGLSSGTGNNSGTGGSSMLTQASSAAEKIRLFRSLFRGREDVFPLRFENRRSGRAGYAPACSNEWVRGLCEKPRVKCAHCPHRHFLQVTDELIRRHLSGEATQGRDFVMGVYPMLLDETCHFLAADFDKDCWQADSSAFLETCHGLASRPPWSAPAREQVRTSGCSSRRPSRRFLQESSAPFA